MPKQSTEFEKYKEGGAYHWQKAITAPPWRRSLRMNARYGLARRMVARRISLAGASGADLGCGDGAFVYLLSQRGCRIVGIDDSMTGTSIASRELRHRARTGAEIVCASACQCPLADATLDFATAIEVVEHLTHPQEFFDEVGRLLRPAGVFVCTTPNSASEARRQRPRDPYHVKEFTAGELEVELRRVFEEVVVLGAFPSWLAAPSGNARWWGGVRLALRAGSQALLFVGVNVFERFLTPRPAARHDLLVGVAERPRGHRPAAAAASDPVAGAWPGGVR